MGTNFENQGENLMLIENNKLCVKNGRRKVLSQTKSTRVIYNKIFRMTIIFLLSHLISSIFVV